MKLLIVVSTLLATTTAVSFSPLSKPFRSPQSQSTGHKSNREEDFVNVGEMQENQVNVDAISHSPEELNFDYDLIVIGGGSGGLAAAKEAKKYGKRVAVLDYVKPSPKGSKWGLGGTCVNVGCIPKKLMHAAALMGEHIKDSVSYGWQVNPEPIRHSWVIMKENVQNHIRKLNFGYRGQLRMKGVDYINKLGKFVGPNKLECTDSKGLVQMITAGQFIIAVGGRPTPLECVGNELAISSDDLFMLEKAPGRTCVVGAGYVALECAGFLSGLKQGEVTVLVRSVPLRSFDRDVVERILRVMRESMTIVTGVTPVKIEKTASGNLKVSYSNGENEEFDTVLAAVGRRADTLKLGLENVGVKVNSQNGKIICVNEETSVPNIYAVGDVMEGCPELTPVAIHAGKLLAKRLYGGSEEQMNYKNIATTVFTPLEMGTVGLTEEEAISLYGSEVVDCYTSEFEPLEWNLRHEEREEDVVCYIKIVVNKLEDNKVIGMHIAAPNAGEIIQGFALAFRLGITHKDLLNTVGVHPTIAEQFTMLEITKSSGEDAEKSSC